MHRKRRTSLNTGRESQMDRSHMRLEPDQCNIHILDRACLNSSEYADGASHGFRWRCIERPCLARAVEAHTAKTPYSCRQTDHRARKCRLQCPDSSRRFEPYWVDESPSWHHIHCMAATSSHPSISRALNATSVSTPSNHPIL